MNKPRRRTRAGLPVAVIIAILTAIFSSRSRAPQRAPDQRVPRSTPAAPATAPTASRDAASPGATASATTPASGGGPGFTNRRHLVEHFEKHGGEFPGLDLNGYLRAAQSLRDAPAGGNVLELRRNDGVVTRFDRTSGAFLATNRDRTIRTFFRPNDGEAYFRRQASRTPGGGP
jgi:pyocin large subunit-like protein